MPKRMFLSSCFIFLSFGLGFAENWPQWRGPRLDGVSVEKNLPLRWSTTENIAWKLALPGFSASTPAIWGNRVFLNVPEADDIHLWCIDKKQGSLVWKKSFRGSVDKSYTHPKHNPTTPSPVTDGKHVYVLNAFGSLRSFDFDGNEIWAREIQRDYGQFGLREGYAASPLLFEGSLYLQVLRRLNGPSYILKIDAKTGKTVWKLDFPATGDFKPADAYATPTVARYGNNRVELVVTGADQLTGHDLATGQELWRASGLSVDKEPPRVAGSPVVAEGIIYSSSYGRPLVALRTGGRGNISESHRIWSASNGPDIPTPVTDGKYFYTLTDKGIVRCLNAKTGQPIWGPERLKPGEYTASPVLADGRLYIINEEGLTSVVKAGPAFEIVAENDLGDRCLSSPAISDGQIFIRTATFLYCIGK